MSDIIYHPSIIHDRQPIKTTTLTTPQLPWALTLPHFHTTHDHDDHHDHDDLMMQILMMKTLTYLLVH